MAFFYIFDFGISIFDCFPCTALSLSKGRRIVQLNTDYRSLSLSKGIATRLYPNPT
jgi:hypothetical protein